MEFVLIALGLATVVGGIVGSAVIQTRGVREHWRKTATALGLAFDKGGFTETMTMRGRLDGIAINVGVVHRSVGETRVAYTVVAATPNVPLPEGLHVHHEGLGSRLAKMLGGQDIPLADPLANMRLRVRGASPESVKAILDHPAAIPALRALLHTKREHYSRIEAGTVILEVVGHAVGGLETLIHDAARAARDLDSAAHAPWDAFAAARGLRQTRDDERSAALDGRIRGLDVLVRLRAADGLARTSFRVSLDGGLPDHNLRIRAGSDGPRLGDPILDGRIVIESTRSAGSSNRDAAVEWIRARLEDDRHDLRGCLLDVLQGLPDAVVEDGTVKASLPRFTGAELAETLDRLLDLGVALSDAAPPDATDTGRCGAAEAGQTTRRRR